MIRELNTEFILALYHKFADDLRKVRAYEMRLFIHSYESYRFWIERVVRFIMGKFGLKVKNLKYLKPAMDDIEAEITYLLIRETRPQTVIEISPYLGSSTTWILNALKDNNCGKLYSYDLISDSVKTIPLDLSQGRWTFIKGDIKENIDKLPCNIDFLFMDSDHSARFAHWYIQNIFPKLKAGVPVTVHDVFHTVDPCGFDGEGGVIIDWLENAGIRYFTASYAKENKIYNRIMLKRKSLGLERPLSTYHINSMIFFVLKDRQSEVK